MRGHEMLETIEHLNPAYIEAATKKPKAKKRRLLKWGAIAACLAVLAVSAEASNGFVSNLLAPLYGGAQTELVNEIGVPVGASVTVQGYTLTADAIIGDRYNIAVVYTLRREDGQPMPNRVWFDSWHNSVQIGSGSGSLEVRRSEDGLSYQLIEQWTSSYISLLYRSAQVRFENLFCYDGEEAHLLAEGVWELKFTVRYKDTTVKIPIDELEVIGSEGYHYQIRKLSLSPIGIHMELTAPNTINRNDPNSRLMPDFHVSVMLNDGTVIELVEASRGGGGDISSDVIEAHYDVIFNPPIPLDTIKALIICDTTYEINLAQ